MRTTTDPKPPKRGASRFSAGLPTVMECGKGEFSCEAVNLSRSGALLIGDLPEDCGPRFSVTIRAGGEKPLELACQVESIRADREQDGTVVIGIRFGTLTNTEKRTLDLLVSRIVEGVSPAPLQALQRDAPAEEVRAALDKIPLPHRIALAARASTDQRAQLMRDSSLQVLESLARNPGLNNHEVKLLLRLPQLLPTTLEIIADDVRWKTDEELKIMVATHPRTTVQITEKVVATMSEVSVAKTLQRSGLPLEVKAKLLNPVERRRLRHR